MEKFKDVTLFLSGDPEKKIPPMVSVAYRVVNGKATSGLRVLTLNDPDTSMPFETFWTETLRQIKVNEGIE